VAVKTLLSLMTEGGGGPMYKIHYVNAPGRADPKRGCFCVLSSMGIESIYICTSLFDITSSHSISSSGVWNYFIGRAHAHEPIHARRSPAWHES
jgi:hypothetical protein